MKPRYRVKKETPELKKGAILEVKGCYKNGEYDYKCSDRGLRKFDNDNDMIYSPDTVEKQPKWFEKVKLLWFTESDYKRVKKFLKLKG